MAKQTAPKKTKDLCPNCYLNGVEEDLNYSPGRFGHFCNNGHEYHDREELNNLLQQVQQVIARNQPAPEPSPEPEPTPEPDPAVKAETPIRLYIDKVDQDRMEAVLGTFHDAATLFGAIFAMNEELKDLKERLTRADTQKKLSQVRSLGGDLSFEGIVPERWAEPVKQICKENGMDVTRYMNGMIEYGFDNHWFV